MNKLGFFVSMVFLVGVAGCGSDDNVNDFGYNDMIKNCSALVSGFQACGGDVKGTWKYEGQCADVEISGFEQLETLKQVCPGFDMGFASDLEGDVIIDETTMKNNITSQTMVARIFIPSSCMVGASCSKMETALKEQFAGQSDTQADCSSSGDCLCYLSVKMGGMQDSQEYTIEGAEMVIAGPPPDGDIRLPYCITGNSIVVVRSDEDEETGMSGDFYMRLSKQAW